jgi:hypothetical protein
MRDYQGAAGAANSVAAGGGSRGSTVSQGQSSSAETSVLTLTVPNGGSVSQDFGVLAQVGAIYGSYQMYRVIAAANAVETGTFHLAHDGTNAESGNTGMVVLPAGTFIGVLFSASIAAGQLRLTLTDDQASGENITVELFYTRRLPLF